MEPPFFGGEAGQPVPQVDPDDVKAVWAIYQDVAGKHPGNKLA